MNWQFWSRRQPAEPDTCAAIEPLLSLHSDGMTSPAEARRVESHLPACDDCRRALEWMQATRVVIAERPTVEPPANLRARIAAAIAESERAAAPVRPVRRPLTLRPALTGALAACALIGFGFALTQELTPQHRVATLPPAPPAIGPASPGPSPTHTAPLHVAKGSVGAGPRKVRQAPIPPLDRVALRPNVNATPPHVSVAARLTPDVRASWKIAKSPTKRELAFHPAFVYTSVHTPKAPLLAINRPLKSPTLTVIKPFHAAPPVLEAGLPPSAPVETRPDASAPPTVTPSETAPRPVQIARIEQPIVRPKHEDLMSDVRTRIANFQSGAEAHKVYMNAVARSDNYVQAAITWTPTNLPSK